mgnify:CR=1 FL=1
MRRAPTGSRRRVCIRWRRPWGCSVADFFPVRPDAVETENPAAALLGSVEGRGLADAFPRIADPEVRRALTRVVQALAEPAPLAAA